MRDDSQLPGDGTRRDLRGPGLRRHKVMRLSFRPNSLQPSATGVAACDAVVPQPRASLQSVQ